MVYGIKGGNARHPCPYCRYNAQEECLGEHRDWDHYCMSFEDLQTKYSGDPTKAKDCNGVECLPILKFRDPTLSLSIASVHAQIGLREKLTDRIAYEPIGEMQYKQLQDSWIIPTVGPPKRCHGGTYPGVLSVKLMDCSNGINLEAFPALQPLIPVLQAASEMIHSTFGRELKGNGYHSIRNFSSIYFGMREICKNKEQSKTFLQAGLSKEEREKEIAKKISWINNITRLTTKIHFLLNHFEDF